MIKKTISYVDYDGNERTEDKYFHMSKRELIKWETESGSGGMDKMIERMIKEEDRKKLVDMFDDLILRSYGEKSIDGRSFIKSDEIRNNFANSAAYDSLFYELLSDTNAATEFVNGLIPNDVNGLIPNDIKTEPKSE